MEVDCGATLIVCPASILPQWEQEISRHTHEGESRHGPLCLQPFCKQISPLPPSASYAAARCLDQAGKWCTAQRHLRSQPQAWQHEDPLAQAL